MIRSVVLSLVVGLTAYSTTVCGQQPDGKLRLPTPKLGLNGRFHPAVVNVPHGQG